MSVPWILRVRNSKPLPMPPTNTVTPSAAMMAEDLAEKWLRNCFEASTFVFYVESAVNNNKTEEVLVGLFDNNKKGGGLESSKTNHQLKNNQRK